jgi:SAM-dependent methyltransferase
MNERRCQARIRQRVFNKLYTSYFRENFYSDGKVLEIGCGLNDDKRIKDAESLDIDPKVNPTFVLDFRKKLPFKNKEFDLVVCRHTLCCYPKSREKIIREFRRIARVVYIQDVKICINKIFGKLVE